MKIPLTDRDAIMLAIGDAERKARTGEFCEEQLFKLIYSAIYQMAENNFKAHTAYIHSSWGKVSIAYKYGAPSVTRAKIERINEVWYFTGAERVSQPMVCVEAHLAGEIEMINIEFKMEKK